MSSKISFFIKVHFHFVLCGMLFVLLLARNPFSQRTLIPNLEPYPDSFHYVVPALSFLHGHSFVIEREGRTIAPEVPPLYSFVLVPFFALKQDVRMFYFANVMLSLWAYGLFCVIIKMFFEKKSIQILLLFLYVTHGVLIWFPTLAMAENLLLVLFLESILLMISPSRPRRAVLAGIIAVSFYATKYASLPLAICFPLLYISKLLIEKRERKSLPIFRYFLRFIVSLIITGILYICYEYFVKNNSVIGNLVEVLMLVISSGRSSISESHTTDSGFFSLVYVGRNTTQYLHWLIGDPLKLLWKNIQILPKFLTIPAIIGLVVGLLRKKTRILAVSLIGMIAATLIFLSIFYDYDARYFFIAIPSLILGIGLFFSWVYATFPKKSVLISIGIGLLLVLYLGLSFRSIKFQIALNLKYAETPWYYISVHLLSEYLHSHVSKSAEKPIVITSLPPYLVDAYSKEPALLLPLDKKQEFRSQLHKAWGDYDFDNLDMVYLQFLTQGRKVYLMKYGLGNEQYLHEDFDRISNKFHATQVMDGCFELCNLYELHLP
ncbi:MAG: hypothetical protein ABI758_03380 [Candidatus Woesebacteria bacterium]